MRTDTPYLLQLADITAGLEVLMHEEQSAQQHGGRYLVEVCWHEGGRVVSRSYQVRAANESQAAAKAHKLAMSALEPGRASRLEITDIERINRSTMEIY